MTIDIQAIKERRNDGYPFGGAEEDVDALLAEVEAQKQAYLEVNQVAEEIAERLAASGKKIQQLTNENTYHSTQLDRAREEIQRLQKALVELKAGWIPVSWKNALEIIDNALNGAQEIAEIGYYFCANCGNTPFVDVPFDGNQKGNCSVCGFEDWIFEPNEGVTT